MKKIALNDPSQWEEVLQKSHQNGSVIFKHSSRCGISSMVLRKFEKELASKNLDYNYFFVDIIRNRQISNLVQEKTTVLHESPQVILMEKGKVMEHGSHGGILFMSMFQN